MKEHKLPIRVVVRVVPGLVCRIVVPAGSTLEYAVGVAVKILNLGEKNLNSSRFFKKSWDDRQGELVDGNYILKNEDVITVLPERVKKLHDVKTTFIIDVGEYTHLLKGIDRYLLEDMSSDERSIKQITEGDRHDIEKEEICPMCGESIDLPGMNVCVDCYAGLPPEYKCAGCGSIKEDFITYARGNCYYCEHRGLSTPWVNRRPTVEPTADPKNSELDRLYQDIFDCGV